MLLTVCKVLATQEAGSRESFANVLPFLAPNSNLELLNDATEMGLSINVLKEDESGFRVNGAILSRNMGISADLDLARDILLRIAKRHFPELIAFSFLEIRRVRSEVDDNLRSVLDDCRLLEVDLDPGAITWWESLKSLGQFTEDESKKEIGSNAEKLSIAYEVQRLGAFGLRTLDQEVKWVAENNDRAGFDVLSLNFGTDSHFLDQSGLQIEVKVGRKEDAGSFSVMLTRHEHRILLSRSMAWVLHVWLYKPGRAEFSEEPLTISREKVEEIVPQTFPNFEWETARITFPMSA